MIKNSMRNRLLATTIICGTAFAALPVMAQDAAAPVEEIVVTGSRIAVPGIKSASPIVSVGSEELKMQATPELGKVIRNLPISVPGDGENVNNGTAGVSTVNLRGLGAQRNLILLNGHRMTPYNVDGRVDVSNIPTSLIDRIDVVTGGASAVYGSDAISGAINFITKRNFEGVEFNSGFAVTGENDGQTYNADLTLGTNMADGRGNATIFMNYSKREGVQLGARPFGLLGVVTADGSNLGATTPPAPAAGCGGPGAVAAGGSTTTVPTRVSITGGPGLGQFRDDGSIGANCSVFNFNPFNYYQTPQERWGGTAMGHFDVTEHVEAYATLMFSKTNVRQQVAPSGVFGSAFFVPMANPFLSASARNTIIAAANAGRIANTVVKDKNWRDLNNNNVVDAADDVQLSVRRRTGELGERSSTYNNNTFQLQMGLKGDLFDDWTWDTSFQYGEADRTEIRAGYTNVTNFGLAMDAVSTTACRSGGSCVPVNVFGGYGTITPAMAAFVGATALQKQSYSQTIATATVGGSLKMVQSPWATAPLAVSIGTEYREENGSATPDECLKLAPASCLGGAGGNTLPISGGFSVKEIFGEAILPIANDLAFAKSLNLELGYRHADYNITGVNRTWKVGFNWSPVDSLLIRVMRQKAARAPNVGELFAPLVSSLRNASKDPCSITNASVLAGNATLRARCVATGMTAAQVGTVQDIVSGQIGTFEGSDLLNPPKPESADTTTIGFVWTPDFLTGLKRPYLSADYYNIEIKDYIGTFGVQEILDQCYNNNDLNSCSKIIRQNGDLASPAAGVQRFTTNTDYAKAEGIELGVGFGLNLDTLGLDAKWGSLDFALTANKYLANESRSSPLVPIIDCLGYYGTQCGNPTHEVRWTQRTTWKMDALEVSYFWRHLGETKIEKPQVEAGVFKAFQKIDAYDYVDLSASYAVNDTIRISAGVKNVFDENPPIVGNEAGTTDANSGNTFPSNFDTLGRFYNIGLNLRF